MSALAYISFDRVPAPKGAATHIEAFVKPLARAFGRVDLVTVGDAVTEPVERWPQVFHTELPARGRSLIDRALDFRRHLKWWLKPREFQAIQFRSIFEGRPIVAERKSARLIFEVNGLHSIELKYHYPGCEDDRELMRKFIAQERACLAAACAIVTPSSVTRRFLIEQRGAPPNKIHVIPNGVDLDLFEPSEPPHAPPLRLLYFGTLSPWQGVDLAIRALEPIQREVPAVLTILGPGPRRRKLALERLAAKLGVHIDLREPVSQSELARHLAQSHVVLAPLPWNDRNVVQGCCPLKVLEAMAAGRPVIASDLEVVRELGHHEEHLLLAKPGSVDAIAAAVLRLAADPILAQSLGRNARRRASESYSWTKAGSLLVNVYRGFLDQP